MVHTHPDLKLLFAMGRLHAHQQSRHQCSVCLSRTTLSGGAGVLPLPPSWSLERRMQVLTSFLYSPASARDANTALPLQSCPRVLVQFINTERLGNSDQQHTPYILSEVKTRVCPACSFRITRLPSSTHRLSREISPRRLQSSEEGRTQGPMTLGLQEKPAGLKGRTPDRRQ